MKKTILFVSLLGLFGCSASSLQKGEPVFSGHSSKSPHQINKCLAPKWQDLHPQANSIETETGYKISASDDLFGVLSMALIDNDNAGGSYVNVYAANKGIGNPWGNAAKSCL
ncbi:TPA: hypothetical protein R4041_005460 [Citrobacter freundii]|uniref:hypothetical protein n=1 Tax=Citrobacter freundii TaxID=546 RepID=UPI001C7D351D|nr:hypothetical protein [Citrobacter freundii]ELO3997486.1 hypothetical protein [Citrobacter freundii]HED2901760.1 hypothetical protein [Citrobacter freundii]HED3073495.1 hypothetical protein [Citrobacter freundii]HED3603151.1 hypothetical protein [Citrobacter freundii]